MRPNRPKGPRSGWGLSAKRCFWPDTPVAVGGKVRPWGRRRWATARRDGPREPCRRGPRCGRGLGRAVGGRSRDPHRGAADHRRRHRPAQDLPVVVVDSGPRSRYPAIDNDQSSGARLDAGRDVPGDVSVVGFDMPESANFVPPLTTTTQPPTQTPPPRGNRHGAAGDHRLVRCPSPCRRGR